MNHKISSDQDQIKKKVCISSYQMESLLFSSACRHARCNGDASSVNNIIDFLNP